MPKLFSITFILRTQAGTPHFQQPVRLLFGIWKWWRRVWLHVCISAWKYYCSVYPIQRVKHFCAAWVLIYPLGYHWEMEMLSQTLRMRRITWTMRRGQMFTHTWNPWPQFAYSLSNLYGCTTKINWVIPQNSVWSVHAQNHVSLE